jgi:ribokinase
VEELRSYTHLVVGNINLDMYFAVPRLPGPDEDVRSRDLYMGPGGAASNYAVAVSRLGHRARLVGYTGTHVLAEELIERLEGEGVDTSLVKRVEGRLPGIIVILVLGGGERSMISYRGVNEMLSGREIPLGEAARTDLLYFSSTRADVVLGAGEAVRASRLAAYDPGGEALANPGGVREAAAATDHLFINARELRSLAGRSDPRSASELLGGRLRRVIVKWGARGSYLVESDGAYFIKAYRHGSPVDSTGAGDAFAAAFNALLLETGDPLAALKAASVAAGIKVTRRGAQSSPRREELEEALEGWRAWPEGLET